MVKPYEPAPFRALDRAPLAKGPVPAQMVPHAQPGGNGGRGDNPYAVASVMAATDMRTFSTGATRNTDTEKLDYEGFLSPQVLRSYAQYMHTHRKQADGTLRSADNWQSGLPRDVYMKSLWRHFMDIWMIHRGYEVNSPEDDHVVSLEEALCAALFNVQGMLFEVLEGRSV